LFEHGKLARIVITGGELTQAVISGADNVRADRSISPLRREDVLTDHLGCLNDGAVTVAARLEDALSVQGGLRGSGVYSRLTRPLLGLDKGLCG